MTTSLEDPRKMSIWLQLSKIYANSDRNFMDDLEWHVNHGYVFVGPGYFLMGSDVVGRGWHIHLAIGNMQKFLLFMPYYLPKIGWSRDPSGFGEITWYDTDKLTRHL